MTLIRPERPDDVPVIRDVTTAAFGAPVEAELIEALRAADDVVVSLVAEDPDGAVVGHILFSGADIDGCPSGTVVGLAPMAVLPTVQRQGIGSLLVRSGLEACGSLGARAAVVLGHPEYYPRFGFVPASRFGLHCRWEVPDDVFLALELEKGALDPASGEVRYAAAFDAF